MENYGGATPNSKLCTQNLSCVSLVSRWVPGVKDYGSGTSTSRVADLNSPYVCQSGIIIL